MSNNGYIAKMPIDHERYDRIRMLFGDDFEKIYGKKVLVCGLGGVGGVCFDALHRSGLDVDGVDYDKFELSNQNRQLYSHNIGRSKAQVYEEIYGTKCYDAKIDKEFIDMNAPELASYDVIIDCIDDVSAKVELAFFAHFHKIKLFSSGGGGRRTDPGQIRVDYIERTYGDPLCKRFRAALKERDFRGKIKVVFSPQPPICQELGSFMAVSGSFGYMLASLCVDYLLNKQ